MKYEDRPLIKVSACMIGEYPSRKPLTLGDPMEHHSDIAGDVLAYAVDLRAFGVDALLHLTLADRPKERPTLKAVK